MKANKLREMSTEELTKQMMQLKSELFNLRFQQAAGTLNNPMIISQTKHEIARIKTILCEREMKAAE